MAQKLSELTSRDAVLEALKECDQMGCDEFLKHYGYQYSRRYPLEHDGRIYDSKAIVGVAYGKQHGKPLKPAEFSGGIATVVPVLGRLGFVVNEAAHPAVALSVGATYYRKDLRDWYGGQLQAGIWTPREFPVVFIFSGESGAAYGYRDDWASDGVFKYTGEGQIGDMEFTGGNAAIRDHREDGKDLMLFKDLGKGKGVRYEGLFECAAWEELDGTDKNKSSRKLIVFDLVPLKSPADLIMPNGVIGTQKSVEVSFEALRKAAYAAARTVRAAKGATSTKRAWYDRSEQVRSYVLARANGVCEACESPAPFVNKGGEPYLEPHHTTRLADEGPDHPEWVAAICPNCHRRVHSGQDGAEWNKRIQDRIQEKEIALGKWPT